MTAISYHDTVKDLQDLDWREDDPFAQAHWFAMLEDAGIKPLIALCKDGENAAALALHWSHDQLEILTNWYAFTWRELRTCNVADNRLLEALAKDLSRRAARIILTKLPGEDGTLARFTRAFRKAGWWVFEEPCDVNHYLPVAGRSYDQYLASRPGQLRSTIKRKSKLVDISISQTFEPQDWASYEAIYAQSWKPEEGDPAMLRSFAEHESAAGRLRFGLARHEGEPVAAQFWTVQNAVAYIHKLAHLEAAKQLSAGTSLSAALFEQVIDRDQVREVDFGTGDDAYKCDWMENLRQRYTLTCLRPARAPNWAMIARLLARKLVRGGGNG